ncbi:MAG: nitroreductase [Bacillota bacterium]|nr:nitroreductase [Bacillota bacterium]
MNETLKTILERRSIRKYSSEQIKDSDLQAILEAGKFAPSAMNQQPWHFTVIQNQEMLKRINEICKTILIKVNNSRMEEQAQKLGLENVNLMYNAPTLMIASGNKNAVAPSIDCSLAMENMFLAAASLGIGSCWIHALTHLDSDEEGKEFLVKESLIPKDYILVGSAVFGYNAAAAPVPPRRAENNVTIIK